MLALQGHTSLRVRAQTRASFSLCKQPEHNHKQCASRAFVTTCTILSNYLDAGVRPRRSSPRAPHVWRRAAERERVSPFTKCVQTTRELLQRRERREGPAVPRSPTRGREPEKEEGGGLYYRMCAMNAHA